MQPNIDIAAALRRGYDLYKENLTTLLIATLLATSVIVGARGIGVKSAVHASTELTGCEVRGTGTGLETREGATIRMAQGLLEGTNAAHAGKDEMRYGPTRIELKEVAVKPDAVYKAGQGSTITLDGKPVGQGKAAKGT